MTKKQQISLEKLEIKSSDFDKDNNLIDMKIKPHFFTCKRGFINISGEYGDGLIDYYGEFRGGYPYIHPALEAWAKKNGFYWEWNDPGSICLIEN